MEFNLARKADATVTAAAAAILTSYLHNC
jgi:hypothetical protein